MIRDILKEFIQQRTGKAPLQQTPQIYAIFCSDSRLDSSAFTHEPVNKMFVSRNIGNQALGILGSASYATHQLPTIKLVTVVGHVGCGAVAAAHELSRKLKPEFEAASFEEALEKTVTRMKNKEKRILAEDAQQAIREELMPMAQFFANTPEFIGKDIEHYPKHAAANVHLQTKCIMQLNHIKEKVASKELFLIGAIHDFLGSYASPGSTHIININGSRDIESHEILDEELQKSVRRL